MSAATLRMPLHTSQDAPCFCGAANDLCHYITAVEALCQSCHHATDADLIKYAVYYTDEASWSTFATAQDALASPTSWDNFKKAIQDLYPRYEVVHAPVPLHASLPPPAAIHIPLFSALPEPLLPSAPLVLPADPAHVPLQPPSSMCSAPMLAPLLPTPAMPGAALLLAPDGLLALLLPHAPLMQATAPMVLLLPMPPKSLLPSQPLPLAHVPVPPAHADPLPLPVPAAPLKPTMLPLPCAPLPPATVPVPPAPLMN